MILFIINPKGAARASLDAKGRARTRRLNLASILRGFCSNDQDVITTGLQFGGCGPRQSFLHCRDQNGRVILISITSLALSVGRNRTMAWPPNKLSETVHP